MKIIRNLTFVLSIAAFPALAQKQQPWSDADADIGNEQVVIVKERENELPPANRNYQKVPPQEVSPTKEDVRYNFPEYSLKLKPIDPTVRVLTIKTDPPAEYYNRYIKAGIGNYFSTYLDGWVTSKREASHLLSLHVNHRGAARGPVDRGNSGYSTNKIEGKGSYFGKSATFDGEVYAQRERYNFYGYNEEAITPEKSDIKQVFNMYGVSAGIRNAESEKLGIGAKFAFDHTGSFTDVTENVGRLSGNLRYEMSDELGVRIEAHQLLSGYNDVNGLSRSLFRLQPAFRFKYDPVGIVAGFNLAYENDTASNANRMHFYPKAEVSLAPAESVEALVGIEGNMVPVTYRSLISENPFLNNQIPLLHTNKTIDFYGELKGRVGGGFGFNAGFSVANYQNMYFFVNSNTDSTRFDVLYDEGNTALVNIYGGISFHSTDKFRTSLRADYFGYNTEKVPVAWHKPSYKVEWLGSYNLYDKILFSADAYVLGGIVAREIGTLDGKVELNPVVDLGLGVEYLFSRQASAYLKFNNLLARNFERYYNYPSRGLVVTIGGSYAF